MPKKNNIPTPYSLLPLEKKAQKFLESVNPIEKTERLQSFIASYQEIESTIPEEGLQDNLLHRAARGEYCALIKVLVLETNYRTKINNLNHEHLTALHCAILESQKKSCQLLVELGADLTKLSGKDHDETAPIQFAILCGEIEIFNLLISLNPNALYERDHRGRTLLLSAAICMYHNIRKIDSKKKADAESHEQSLSIRQESKKQQALYFKKAHDAEQIANSILTTWGEASQHLHSPKITLQEFNQPDQQGLTPLMFAVLYEKTPLFKKLAPYNTESTVNTLSHRESLIGDTCAIFIAIDVNNVTALKTLLAMPSIKTKWEEYPEVTLLRYAIERNAIACIPIIMEKMFADSETLEIFQKSVLASISSVQTLFFNQNAVAQVYATNQTIFTIEKIYLDKDETISRTDIHVLLQNKLYYHATQLLPSCDALYFQPSGQLKDLICTCIKEIKNIYCTIFFHNLLQHIEDASLIYMFYFPEEMEALIPLKRAASIDFNITENFHFPYRSINGFEEDFKTLFSSLDVPGMPMTFESIRENDSLTIKFYAISATDEQENLTFAPTQDKAGFTCDTNDYFEILENQLFSWNEGVCIESSPLGAYSIQFVFDYLPDDANTLPKDFISSFLHNLWLRSPQYVQSLQDDLTEQVQEILTNYVEYINYIEPLQHSIVQFEKEWTEKRNQLADTLTEEEWQFVKSEPNDPELFKTLSWDQHHPETSIILVDTWLQIKENTPKSLVIAINHTTQNETILSLLNKQELCEIKDELDLAVKEDEKWRFTPFSEKLRSTLTLQQKQYLALLKKINKKISPFRKKKQDQEKNQQALNYFSKQLSETFSQHPGLNATYSIADDNIILLFEFHKEAENVPLMHNQKKFLASAADYYQQTKTQLLAYFKRMPQQISISDSEHGFQCNISAITAPTNKIDIDDFLGALTSELWLLSKEHSEECKATAMQKCSEQLQKKLTQLDLIKHACEQLAKQVALYETEITVRRNRFLSNATLVMQNVAIHLFDYKYIDKKTKDSLIRLKICADAYQNNQFADIDFSLLKLISNFFSEYKLLQLSLEKITAALAERPIAIEALEDIARQLKSIDLTDLQLRLQNNGVKISKKIYGNYKQDCVVCEKFFLKIEATLQEEENKKNIALEIQRAAQIAEAEKKAAHLEQQRIEAERRRLEVEEKKRIAQASEQQARDQVLAKPEITKLNYLSTLAYCDFQKITQLKTDHALISNEVEIELEIYYLSLSIKVITLLEHLHTLNHQKGAQNLAARLAHLFPILFTESAYRGHFDHFIAQELPLFIEQFIRQYCNAAKFKNEKLHFNTCQFSYNTPETRKKQITVGLAVPTIDLTTFLELLMGHINKLTALQQKFLLTAPEFQASITFAKHCLLRAVIEHYHQLNSAHKKEADKIFNGTNFLTRKELGLLIEFRNTYRHTKPIEFKAEDKISDEFICNTERFATLLIRSMPFIRIAALQRSSPLQSSPALPSFPLTLFSAPLNPSSDHGYHSATSLPTPPIQSAASALSTSQSMLFSQIQDDKQGVSFTPSPPAPPSLYRRPSIS